MLPPRLLRALWVLILGWSLLPVAGQQPSFRSFSLQEGLPQSQVTALLEDHHGFIWVGTETGGVGRLGASGFKAFGAQEGMKARLVRGLLEDGEGHIWVGHEEGVSEVQGDSVQNFGTRQGLVKAPTLALGLDGAGRVLVGNHAGLFRLEGGRFVRVALPAPFTTEPIRFLARDRGGGIWLAGSGHLIGRWDGEALRAYPLPRDHATAPIRDLQVDPEGRVWVLLEDALLRMERGIWTPEPLSGLPVSPKLTSLRFDPQDNGFLVALGGDGLLVRTRDGRTQRLTTADGLPRDRIMIAIRDRRNILWIGSDGDGMAAQVLSNLYTLDRDARQPSQDLSAVTSMRELPDGKVFLAASTGVYLVEPGRGVTGHWDQSTGLPANQTWSLLPDGNGGMWAGTDRGLAHWRGGRVRAEGPRELARTSVLTLVRDEGRILAGTEQGLFILDAEGKLLSQVRLPPETGTTEIANV
ncbi:MAG TPA: two-component regulator propeller domain-containing protein, partial [Holophagaceae bacterium]